MEEKMQHRIQQLEERNKQVEHQSLMRELARIKNKSVDDIKENYKDYTNENLTVLIKELDNNPDFAVFQAQKKEEKQPLIFYAGTYTRGKWSNNKEEIAQ